MGKEKVSRAAGTTPRHDIDVTNCRDQSNPPLGGYNSIRPNKGKCLPALEFAIKENGKSSGAGPRGGRQPELMVPPGTAGGTSPWRLVPYQEILLFCNGS